VSTERSSQGRFTGASIASRSFEAAVFVTALICLGGIYLRPASELAAGPETAITPSGAAGWFALLGTAAAVALGGIYRLPIGAKRQVSFGSGAAFAGLLVFPPAVALMPAAAGVLTAQLVNRWRWRRLTAPTIVFNVMQYLVSWSVAILLFHRLWANLAWLPPGARFWAAGAVCGAGYLLVNTWVVATWAALRKRTAAWTVWRQGLRESLAAHASMLLLGIVAARLAIAHPVWVLPLLVSTIVVFVAQSRVAKMQRRRITLKLSCLIDSNERLSPYMHEHSERVAWWAERLAREAGFSDAEAELVWFAGKLHDLGMMLLRQELETTPDALTDAQEALVQRHPAVGAEAIAPLSGMSKVAQYVRGHHENYDGTGYPDGLAGDAIPFGARILRVVGAYDGLRSPRPHRPPYDEAGALALIRAQSGRYYDPFLVAALERLVKSAQDAPSFAGVFAAAPPSALAFASAPAAGHIAWPPRQPHRDTAGEENDD
jgi:hypothetical protein